MSPTSGPGRAADLRTPDFLLSTGGAHRCGQVVRAPRTASGTAAHSPVPRCPQRQAVPSPPPPQVRPQAARTGRPRRAGTVPGPWYDCSTSPRTGTGRQVGEQARREAERVSERVVELPSQGRPSAEFERTPPQDLAAEQSVLGGMLLSKDAIADVVEVVRAGDFYKPAHQTIFDVVVDLYGKGEPADPITVSAELTRLGEIGRVGGAPYLHTLLSSVPTAANAGFYARIVAEQAILRRLVEAGTRIVQLGYGAAGTGTVDDIVDRAQQTIYDVTERRTSRGLHAARAAHAADDGRARGHRQPRRLHVRRPHRLRRPRRPDQRPAPRPDDRHRRPSRARQGARARHPAADARPAGPRWARSRVGDLLLGRRRPADAGRRRDRRPDRPALLRGHLLRRHPGRRRRRAPVADQHPRVPAQPHGLGAGAHDRRDRGHRPVRDGGRARQPRGRRRPRRWTCRPPRSRCRRTSSEPGSATATPPVRGSPPPTPRSSCTSRPRDSRSSRRAVSTCTACGSRSPRSSRARASCAARPSPRARPRS